MYTRLRLALGLFVAAVSNAHGQSGSTTAQHVRLVLVYDRETQEPIDGADVLDVVTKNTVKTTSTGTIGLFVPQFVKSDGAALRVTKVGYTPSEIIVVDNPLAEETLLIPLDKQVATLSPVVTTEHYRLDIDPGTRAGFEQRCQSKVVTCYRESELAAHPSGILLDFLSKASGTIENCGTALAQRRGARGSPAGRGAPLTTCFLEMRSVSAGVDKKCEPIYFIDGFATDRSLQDIEQSLPPSQVQGMEVYLPGQPRPLRFENVPAFKSPCGVIVIWTK